MKKETGRSPGRPTSFQGVKLVFLEEQADTFRAATNRGKFYKNVSTAFVNRFGYDKAFEQNPPDGDEDSPPEPLDTFALDAQDAEAERRAGYLRNLREVSYYMAHNLLILVYLVGALQKLGCWYWYRYPQNAPSSPAIASLIQDFVKAGRLHPPKQRKIQSTYYADAWETKLKPRFNAWWATQKHQFGDDAGHLMMKERNLFVEQALKAEPEEYHDELRTQIESEHKIAMSGWKKMTGSVKTANNLGGAE